eukprot:TRINITY_DN133_c0_g1_i4.p1 TRINITY_DN133_c0_g1~~TRINITY_DN133_c0_g1_i4.p1  ORF type:complete len:1879 (+),score=296.24 TRINITY_DN133_c0_g1_i4:87-5723(+)
MLASVGFAGFADTSPNSGTSKAQQRIAHSPDLTKLRNLSQLGKQWSRESSGKLEVSGSAKTFPRLLPISPSTSETSQPFQARTSIQACPFQEVALRRAAPLSESIPAVFVFHIVGNFDIARLSSCWQQLVKRHDALRTTFHRSKAGDLLQVTFIDPSFCSRVRDIDVSAAPDEGLRSVWNSLAQYRFDVDDGRTHRVCFARTSPNQVCVSLAIHPLCLDNCAWAVLAEEFFALLSAGSLPTIVGSSFSERISAEAQALSADSAASWIKQTAEMQAPDLPLDHPRSAAAGFSADSIDFDVAAQSLSWLAQRANVSQTAACAAVLAALVHHWDAGADIVPIGIVLPGREGRQDRVVGGLSRVHLLHVRLSSRSSLTELAESLEAQLREAPQRPFASFAASLDRNTAGHKPLFTISMAFEEGTVLELDNGSARLTTQHIAPAVVVDDIQFFVRTSARGVRSQMVYRRDLFEPETALRFAEHFQHLCAAVSVSEKAPIGSLQVMSATELERVTKQFRCRPSDVGKPVCLHEMFEQQARRTPDAVAVSFEDIEQLTYRELDRRSTQLARQLRQRGLRQRETLVGLYMDKSVELYVSILAVMKAGGAYVPLDPEHPPERTEFMLTDTAAALVLTLSKHVDKLEQVVPASHLVDGSVKIVALDAEARWEAWDDAPLELADGERACGSSLAYVIYTSGTTGRPKGVLLEHAGAHNLIVQEAAFFGVGAGWRLLAFSSISFDVSVSDTFVALTSGATLCCAAKETMLSDLSGLMQRMRISYVDLTPSVIPLLDPARVLPHLKVLVGAGEAMAASIVTAWATQLRLCNIYGPTEVTVTCVQRQCAADSLAQDIGRPLFNVDTYILNDQLQPVPIGVAGELHFGGIQLARGYLNRPDVTAEKFIPNPFAPAGSGAHIYKSGDIARWRADGSIECLGRRDGQVKVRGYRIELGEIESVLSKLPFIKQAAAIVREDNPGDKFIAAYIVFDLLEAEPSEELLKNLITQAKAHCQTHLASYMVPNVFVQLDVLPLTSSAKLDVKSLPVPVRDVDRLPYRAPESELEQQISAVWQNVLKVESVGLDDDFFALGGHSILAVQSVSQMRKLDSTLLNVSIRDLLEQRSISRLLTTLSERQVQIDQETTVPQVLPDNNEQHTLDESTFRFSETVQCMLQLIGLLIVAVFSFGSFVPGIYAMQYIPRPIYIYDLLSLVAVAVFSGGILLTASLLMKWILIGRYRETTFPIGGWYFIRWWTVDRMMRMVDLTLLQWFRGTFLLPVWYRLLGAKIGRNVNLQTTKLFAFDLISIDDNVVLDYDCVIQPAVAVDGRKFALRSVAIGGGSQIGACSILTGGTTVGFGCELMARSCTNGKQLPPNTCWIGSPLRQLAGVSPTFITPRSAANQILFVGFQLIGYLVVLAVMAAGLMVSYAVSDYLSMSAGDFSEFVVSFFLMAYWGLPFGLSYCICVVVLKWILVGKTRPGIYKWTPWRAARYWLVDQLLSNFIFQSFCTVYLNGGYLMAGLMRVLGTKVGHNGFLALPFLRADCDLITVGDDVVSGSNNYYINRRFLGDNVEFLPIELKDRCVLGGTITLLGGAIVGFGATLGEGSMLDFEIPENSVYIGTPAVLIKAAKKSLARSVGSKKSRVWISEPNAMVDAPKRPVQMSYPILVPWLLLFLELAIPLLLGIPMMPAYLVWLYASKAFGATVAYAFIPACLVVGVVIFALMIVVFKRLIIGKFSEPESPIYGFVFLKWTLYQALIAIFDELLALQFSGTPIVPMWLRLMGAKMGKNIYYDTYPPEETDLITVGDDCIIQKESALLPHLIDNGALRFAPIKLGKRCIIGVHSTVMSGSVLNDGSEVGAGGLLMKGEELPANSIWHGNPAVFLSMKTAQNFV